MRLGFEHFPPEMYEEYLAMQQWRTCPLAEPGIHFGQATMTLLSFNSSKSTATEKEKRETAEALLNRVEMLTRELIMGDLNLTQYLQPRSYSFAPFFYLNRFLEALHDLFPDLLLSSFDIRAGEESESELVELVRAYTQRDTMLECPHNADPKTLCGQRWKLAFQEYLDGRRWRGNSLHGRSTWGRALEHAAVHFTEADILRIPLGVQWPGSGDGTEVRSRLKSGQLFLRQALRSELARTHGGFNTGLLAAVSKSRLPIFELLDRLDRQVVVPLLFDSPEWIGKNFFMHVLPTGNIESNHVRSFLMLHCDSVFKKFAEDRRKETARESTFVVVEVGAHLGGCVLSALTLLDSKVRGIAVEPYHPAAEAMRRTAKENKLEERFFVAERFVCEGSGMKFAPRRMTAGDMAPWLHQPDWLPHTAADGDSDSVSSLGELDPEFARTATWASNAGPPVLLANGVDCVTLEEILLEQHVTTVDVLRIHVLGREFSVLESVLPLILAGQVLAVAVAIIYPNARQEPLRIAELLYWNGFSLQYDAPGGQEVWRDIQVLQAFEGGFITRGTSTLLASRVP